MVTWGAICSTRSLSQRPLATAPVPAARALVVRAVVSCAIKRVRRPGSSAVAPLLSRRTRSLTCSSWTGRSEVEGRYASEGRPVLRRSERIRTRSGRALAADHLSLGLARELAAVVHQEATRARELVRLARQHPHCQLFAGQVCAGQLEGLGEVFLVDVHGARLCLGAPSLELFEAVLVEVLVDPRAVVVGSHLCPPLGVSARWVTRR